MHKRLLLALAILIVAIQILIPTGIKAQTPPFAFVSDPTPNVPDAPYVIRDSTGIEYEAFVDVDNPSNLYFRNPQGGTCSSVIYGVPLAGVGTSSVSGTLLVGDCTGNGSDDFSQSSGTSSSISVEASVPGGGTGAEQAPSCASNGGALAWLACPLSELLMNAIGELAHWISTLLQVSPLQTGSQAYTVWEAMRNIALALFVIATLVIIFGQTLGIDAYTIKRTIPRIGVAAIGILLSFYVSAFLIDLFNVLGSGMYSLLVDSLGGIDIQATTGSIIAEWLVVLGAASAVTIGVISQGAFAFFIMILLPILLAFLTGFVVIVARQVIILMLVLVSPLAIAAWILPSTDRWFKRWWNLFTNLLMMYPLIMILLASGTIFAALVTGNEGGAGTITEANFINQIIALLALAITVGMIPFTLKASSSLIGRIAGVAGNPNLGPIDRMRKAGQSRGQFNREARKQDRLKELGDLNRTSPDSKKWRKGWLRATTGTFGYSGKYQDLQKAEAITGSRSAEQREFLAVSKAEQEQGQIADFQLQQRLSGETASGKGIDDIKADMVKEATENYGSAEQGAAFRYLLNVRAVPELEAVFDKAAGDGDMARQSMDKLKAQNFGTLHDYASHLSTGSFKMNTATDKMEFKPQYGGLGDLPAEQLVKQKPEVIRGALASGDTGLAQKIMTTYANAAPQQRTAAINQIMGEAINGVMAVPKFDPGSGKTVTTFQSIKAPGAGVSAVKEVLSEGNITNSVAIKDSIADKHSEQSLQTLVTARGGINTLTSAELGSIASSGVHQSTNLSQQAAAELTNRGETVPAVRPVPGGRETLQQRIETANQEVAQEVVTAPRTVIHKTPTGTETLRVTGVTSESRGRTYVEAVNENGVTVRPPLDELHESHDAATPLTLEQFHSIAGTTPPPVQPEQPAQPNKPTDFSTDAPPPTEDNN